MFSPSEIVNNLGLIGVLLTLFIETSLLIGLILPGDSLLFVSGVAASVNAQELFGIQLSYSHLMIWAPIAATTGSQCGYWLGAKYGRPLFNRSNSRFINQEKVQKTERWLSRYGLGKALIISHFIPFARTIISPLCGILGVPLKQFFIWNVVSSYLWTVGIINLGYFFGERFAGSFENYLLLFVAAILMISLIPIGVEFLRAKKSKSL